MARHAPATETGRFLAPDGPTVSPRGDSHVGEVSYTTWPTGFPDVPLAGFVRSLQKLEKVVA